MNRWNRIVNTIGKRRFILLLSGLFALIVFGILEMICSKLAGSLTDQWEGKRWSADDDYAQVSCYFSVDAGIVDDTLRNLGRQLVAKLENESLLPVNEDGEASSARVYADAFSATGSISVSSDRGSVNLSAIGVYGDFFLFHSIEMCSGSYFSGADLNQDSIILDETSAWQLFGSVDIAGQIVNVGEHPLIVRGVFKRPEGKKWESAGFKDNMCFVSYDILHSDELMGFCRDYGINSYDIVMPNPVKGYAAETITTMLSVDPLQIEVMDTSLSFSQENRFKLLLSQGTRSMNGKAIIYPYWENIARGTEDTIALLNALAFCCLFYTIILYLVLFLIYWYTKSWTVEEKMLILKDRLERWIEFLRESRRNKEESYEKEL